MDMCYDGTLMMPSSYVLMDEEEMMYMEGGAAAIGEIVLLVIGMLGASYGAGKVAGERLYYAGINSAKKYSKVKWQIRAVCASSLATWPFIVGLENELYSRF